MCLHLDSLHKLHPEQLTNGPKFLGNVMVDPSATIAEGCVIGPHVVIGPNCIIERGVRLSRTTILKGATVSENSWINSSIIGWNSTIGKWVRIEGISVLAERVEVQDEKYINGGKILPHKKIATNYPEPGTIVM